VPTKAGLDISQGVKLSHGINSWFGGNMKHVVLIKSGADGSTPISNRAWGQIR